MQNHSPFMNSGDDNSGIIGYQKYLHIISKSAQDNTDAYEPGRPVYGHFLQVEEEEERVEEARRDHLR